MPKMLKKADLDEKICIACGLLFKWRQEMEKTMAGSEILFRKCKKAVK